MLLQTSDDAEEVCCGWVAFGSEHLVKGFYMDAGFLSQRRKAEGRIDEIAQNLAAQRGLAREKRLDGVAQQSAAKLLIAARSRLHRLSKISRQRHGPLLFCRL